MPPDSGPDTIALPELEPERDELDRYLEDTIVVDWQTPAVADKARELCEGVVEEEARVRALFEFVRDEIVHSFDGDSEALPCNASQVLREGTGLCYAKSHLLAAMLRARGIPAGFCYMRIRSDEAKRGYVLHGLVAAYLHSCERWVLLDARGNNGEVQTEFRVDPPSLAYTPDAEEGEQLFPLILTRPAKRVVDLLDYAEDLTQVRNNLPDEF